MSKDKVRREARKPKASKKPKPPVVPTTAKPFPTPAKPPA